MTCTEYDHQPLVSVLMVVLNPHPRYFREAVRSILAQTLQAWELIIVEDPSPRCGRELLSDMHDPRIRYFLNPQRTSLVAQRNRSLAEARADYVAIFDADDLCEPELLQSQVDYLKSHPDIGMVGSQINLIDCEGQKLGTHSYPLTHEQIVRTLHVTVPIFVGSTMSRKTLLHAVGGYRLDVNDAADDYDLLSRLALCGVRFANLSQTLVHYRFHSGQIKATRMRDILRETFRVKKRYWGGQMSFGHKARMYAERCLVWLPATLVHRLVLRLRYGIRFCPAAEADSSQLSADDNTFSLETAIPFEIK